MPKKRSPPNQNHEPTREHVTENGLGQEPTPTGKVTMKVNFSAVSDSFEPRKAGDYQGTLIEHEINQASASSGQPTLRLKWSEDDSPNNFMFRTYSLQPKALWSLKRDLVRIGKQHDGFMEKLNDEDADLDQLVTSLYGTSSTLRFGDPRPYKRKNKTTGEMEDALGDNMLEVVDPDDE